MIAIFDYEYDGAGYAGQWRHCKDHNAQSFNEAALFIKEQFAYNLNGLPKDTRIMFWETDLREILDNNCTTQDFVCFKMSDPNPRNRYYLTIK